MKEAIKLEKAKIPDMPDNPPSQSAETDDKDQPESTTNNSEEDGEVSIDRSQ